MGLNRCLKSKFLLKMGVKGCPLGKQPSQFEGRFVFLVGGREERSRKRRVQYIVVVKLYLDMVAHSAIGWYP